MESETKQMKYNYLLKIYNRVKTESIPPNAKHFLLHNYQKRFHLQTRRKDLH